MKKQLLMGLAALMAFSANIQAQNRALWASINNNSKVIAAAYKGYNKKVLVSWRWLPSDGKDTAFHLANLFVCRES